MFGIVKTAHESKLGDVQKMSYQMVNSLDNDIMENVVKESIGYINKLKTDNNVFLDYLRKNSNFSNDYDVLVALCEQNMEFVRSEYFRDRKKRIVEVYTFNLKTGKIIQNAENLVIIGSPYAMLLYATSGAEKNVDIDDTFCYEQGTIQCYTERFDNGDYLAFFRSPFNSKNNLTYLHNVYSDNLQKYFNFGKQIIAVNMIGTDFQDRNNGSDQDSDSGYCTNQLDIVEHARMCYLDYPTIINNIPKETTMYGNTMSDYAQVDNNLASASSAIGETSNLAQIAQTYTYNFKDQKYIDYVCILSVLAQVAIDNAKRRFDIDLVEEIKRIKKDMDISKNGYPDFWGIVKKDFNKKRINKKLKCPMNYLCSLNVEKFRDKDSTLPMLYFFKKFELDKNRKTCKKVEEIISSYSLNLFNYNTTGDDEEYILLRKDFSNLIKEIKGIYISKNYLGLMSWLIDRAFIISSDAKRHKKEMQSTIDTNKSMLLKILYEINPQNFLKCFSNND